MPAWVILVGLIAEASDGSQTTKLQGRTRDLAAGTRAEQDSGDGAGGQRIVLGHLRRLSSAITHRATGAGDLRTQKLIQQFLCVKHSVHSLEAGFGRIET